MIAQAFATMACLYPDRIVLGLGTGEALNETAVTGADWPDFKGRFARLREAVRLMRQLWTEDGVTFEGEFYRTVDATVYDKPEHPVPVYIAAGGPVVAKYAGRSGDGFICTSGKGMELYTDKLLPAVEEGARGGGARRGRDRPHDRDQDVLRPRPRAGAGELPVLGAAVADRRSRSTA